MKALKKILQRVAEVQSKVLLSLIFISLVPLFSIITKLIHRETNKGWGKWHLKEDSLEDLKRQY